MKTENLETILESLGGEKRICYSLDRFREALHAAGNPEKNVQSIVIAGTNGKGTTTLLVSSALEAAGYDVATFLSPHLQSPRERFLWNMSPIGEEELLEVAQSQKAIADKYQLTYFEFLSLVFFAWCKKRKPRFVVLEVGLGGRLDATNVTDPLAVAITNIDYDHQAFLGDTLPKILEEKLAILNGEGLFFTGETRPELLKRMEDRCNELDSIYYFTREMRVRVKEVGWWGQEVFFNEHRFRLSCPTVGARNSALLAFLLCRIVFPKVSVSTLQSAFGRVVIPGRLEVVQQKPRVVLSGDHNPAGIECLLEATAHLPRTQTRVLCAFSPDKPWQEMIERLKEIDPKLVLTSIPGREIDANLLKAHPHFEPDPNKALDKLLEEADEDTTIIVTGSLYLVGALRGRWRERVQFLSAPSAPARVSQLLASVGLTLP